MSFARGKCDREGCMADAFGQVCLLLFAASDLNRSAGARVSTGLCVCSGHARHVDIDAVLDQAGWARIEAEFIRLGKEPPARRRTVLLVEPLAQPAARR